MNFEWDEVKAEVNLRKHGVSFDEAASVFEDTMMFVMSDESHSEKESRRKVTGTSERMRLLAVIYVLRGDIIRIISARRPTMREVREYAEARD